MADMDVLQVEESEREQCLRAFLDYLSSEEKSEKTFIRSSILYLAVNAIPLLQGSRAVFIIDLLTVLFLRYRLFGKTIKDYTALVCFVSVE